MFTKSTRLIIVSLLVMFFLGSCVFFTLYITKTVEADARLITYTSVLRGSFQRVVKLELNTVNGDKVITLIDNTFSTIYSDKFILMGEKKDFVNSVNILKEHWLKLKDAIYQYRKSPSEESKKSILDSSEKIWVESNSVTNTANAVSQKSMAYFTQIVLPFLFVNVILISIIIFLLKFYVKDELEFLAHHDSLTKVYNRNFYHAFLINELNRVERNNGILTLITFDIDRFKAINDRFGHNEGDYVLKELSLLAKSIIRKSDVLIRMGGEEFTIIVPDTDSENAIIIAEKLRIQISEHKFKNLGKITISLGISQYIKGDDIDSLSKRADIALYKAKDRGRNRIEVQ